MDKLDAEDFRLISQLIDAGWAGGSVRSEKDGDHMKSLAAKIKALLEAARKEAK